MTPDYTASMLPACIAAVEARLALCDAALLIREVDPESEHDGCWDICVHDWEPYHPGETQQYPLRADIAAWLDDARDGYPALLRMELARLREHAAAEQQLAAYDMERPDAGELRQMRRETAALWAALCEGREGK